MTVHVSPEAYVTRILVAFTISHITTQFHPIQHFTFRERNSALTSRRGQPLNGTTLESICFGTFVKPCKAVKRD